MQIYGDPEAADVVFTSGANIVIVGINITTQVQLTGRIIFLLSLLSSFIGASFWSSIAIVSSFSSDTDLLELRKSNGKHSQILCDMCKFYRDWHVKSDGVYGTLLFHTHPKANNFILLPLTCAASYIKITLW